MVKSQALRFSNSVSVKELVNSPFPNLLWIFFKNKGVQLILDAVVEYLPNPTEVNPQPEVDPENETGEFADVDPNKPLRALAFKIMDDKYGARLSLEFTQVKSKKV